MSNSSRTLTLNLNHALDLLIYASSIQLGAGNAVPFLTCVGRILERQWKKKTLSREQRQAEAPGWIWRRIYETSTFGEGGVCPGHILGPSSPSPSLSGRVHSPPFLSLWAFERRGAVAPIVAAAIGHRFLSTWERWWVSLGRWSSGWGSRNVEGKKLGLGSSPGFLWLALNGGQYRGQIPGACFRGGRGTRLGVRSREKLGALHLYDNERLQKSKSGLVWHPGLWA